MSENDLLGELGQKAALLAFAAFSYVSAEYLHNASHVLLGEGTPMTEVLAVSGIMAAYAGIGYGLTVYLQKPEYIPAVAGLGVGSAGVVHYLTHAVGLSVPFVGSTMGVLFAVGYGLYLVAE